MLGSPMKKLFHDNARILVVRPDALGDVTLMIPLLNTLRLTYPKATISVLLQPYTKALLDHHPAVDDIVLDPRKTKGYKGALGFLKFVSYIRAKNYDAVFFSYLDGYLASVMRVAGIPVRVGDGNKLLIRLLLSHPVNQEFRNILCHETEQNLTLISSIEPSVRPSLDMNIICREETKQKATELLRQEGWKGELLIGIHPSTGGGNRAWLPSRYAELINLLHSNTDYKVVVTGFGASDKETIDAICATVETQPIVLFEKTTLEELKGVITHYHLIIGTDTGPTHMAAALSVPVLCVSPTKFVKSLRWGPWNVASTVIGNPKDCTLICNPYRCREPHCLESISASMVFDAIQSFNFNERPSTEVLKSGWVVRSMNVGFYCETTAEYMALKPILFQCQQEGLTTVVFTKDPKLQAQNVFHVASLFSLHALVIQRDINVIYLLRRKTFLWTLFRQFTGPYLYCPTFVFELQNKEYSSFVDRIKDDIRMVYSPS